MIFEIEFACVRCFDVQINVTLSKMKSSIVIYVEKLFNVIIVEALCLFVCLLPKHNVKVMAECKLYFI